ncbi:AAA family ATPase [Flavobacterium fluviatile]|uniref:AAA family ATPase n=1 Tax=Flavobacterium fluviatile TaxID=1862387 RepID=UPI0013D2D9D6|nr:AAA family ATPase [Flavobacterium fluviatile]
MRLVAVFIYEHQFLFDEPQTINLGGKYIYNFKGYNNSSVLIRREENHNYINNFYDLTNTSSKLSLVSAIVGENGTGKTSILDILRSKFVEHSSPFPHSYVVMIGEDDTSDYPILIKSSFESNKYLLNINELDKNNALFLDIDLAKTEESFQSIYYSPHYDYKVNPHFDKIDNYDISFDTVLDNDLNDLANKDSNPAGWNFRPNRELRFKNSLRQISFLSSEVFENNTVFNDIFTFPKHGNPKLIFRAHKLDDIFDNVSLDVKFGALKPLEEKASKEKKARIKRRVYDDKNNFINKDELENERLKTFIVQCIVSVLFRQADKKNTFLSELKLESDFEKRTKDLNYIDTFLKMIEEVKIEYHGNVWKPFSYELIKLFLDNIFSILDNQSYYSDGYAEDDYVQTKVDYDENTIYPDYKDAIEILTLQRKLIIELERYFLFNAKKSEESDLILDTSYKIDGFINYETEKKLSSGENALLNFYSRIYDFVVSNLLNSDLGNRFLPLKKHYILLLDEADLGFHPIWKKKFVKSLVYTLSHIFELIENKPSFQIVFTTHDPLTLSDLPRYNVVYLKSLDNKTVVLENDDRPQISFGANITDLLAYSFFTDDGLIGDFAKEKIEKTLDWLNEILNIKEKITDFVLNKKTAKVKTLRRKLNKALSLECSETLKNKENPYFNQHRKLIAIIDEPIMKIKLAEMYDNATAQSLQVEIISREIEFLQKKMENLNNIQYVKSKRKQ